MAREGMIGTDSPFHEAQRATLQCLLDMIVPASADGRLPSAADVGVDTHLRLHAADAIPALCDELDAVDAAARREHGAAFAALPQADRQALVDVLRARDARFLRRLAVEAVTCYYQHDRVLEAIGLEPRPPFPKGYQVHAGDLSLLEPVRQRGRIWREAP
jgi:hypothetical protein